VALIPEFVLDASAAHKRVVQMNLVHETHKDPYPRRLPAQGRNRCRSGRCLIVGTVL
jgi:hypothetical protein